MVGLPGFEPGSREPKVRIWGRKAKRGVDLASFEKFCLIDLQLLESTAKVHSRLIRKFLEAIGKNPLEVKKEDLRSYLLKIKRNSSPSTYKNVLSALKRFYRDYLGSDLLNGFKFPRIAFKPIEKLPSKAELQRFFRALENPRDRALFLLYASSGLRKSEILSLTLSDSDIDFEKRMLSPKKPGNHSKHVYISFYNSEAEKELKNYLKTRKNNSSRLFPISGKQINRIFRKASEKSGVRVQPQILRRWFSSELGRLGIPDRYIDAFCGRVPKSVLARNYTDFSPEKLKEIYDKAGKAERNL